MGSIRAGTDAGEKGAGHKSRGITTPETYKVGGRHMTKSTDKARDSSLRVDKAPGIQLSSRTPQPRN